MNTLPEYRDGEFPGRKNTKHGTASLELEFFPCDSCEASFTDKKEMMQHVRSSHRCTKGRTRQRQQMSPSENVQCCKTCGKEFNNFTLLNNHQNAHKPVKRAVHYLKTKVHSNYSVRLRSNDQMENGKKTRETKNMHARNSSAQFICIDCGKVFKRSGFFLKHRKSHSKDIQYIQSTKHKNCCLVCGRAFSNQRLLNKHNQLYHRKKSKVSGRTRNSLALLEIKKNVRCCECDRFFGDESLFQMHKCFHLRKHLRTFIAADRRCMTGDIFFCQLCIVTLTSGLDFEVHIKDTHPEQYTKTIKALSKLNNRQSIHNQDDSNSIKDIEEVINNVEEQEDDPGRYMCKTCGKHVKDYYALRRHREKHIKTAQLHCCEVCGKVFGRKDHLKRHRLLHYANTSPLVCAVELKDQRSLQDPEQIHLERNHVCRECGKQYELEEELLLHHELVHPGPDGYTCHHCKKTFLKAKGLRRHRQIHSTKTHNCSQCGKKFGRLEHLQRHKVVHTQIKTHLCDCCGALFARKEELYVHRERTHESKCFLCGVCGKGFNNSGTFRRHRSSHKKVFICDVCGMNFSRQYHLKRHSYQHSDMPFKCVWCRKVFSSAENLTQHKSLHTHKSTCL